MSTYSPFLAFSSHTPSSPKQFTGNKTPTKITVPVYYASDLANSAHQPRPNTHSMTPILTKVLSGPGKSSKLQEKQYFPLAMVNSARQIPHNTDKSPSNRLLPDRGKVEVQLKSRKSSQNNIVFDSKLARMKGKGDYSPVAAGGKYRKTSCNYQALGIEVVHEGGKQARFSMVEEIPLLGQGSRSKKKGKRGFEQTNNFQMDPQVKVPQIIKIPVQSNKNAVEVSPQRKHSDNEQARRTPAFLHLNKSSYRSQSITPRAKFTIQRFRIVSELGRGAYGRVVLAVQRESGCICAIKILSKRELQEQRMVEQLVRQIKIQLFMHHPNVVKIYGYFDDLLHLYIVMQCALDSRLSTMLAKGTFPEQEAASVFYQLCSAVGQMHAGSIIHRDLKPENVMLHEGVVKVCDFGWSVYRGAQLRTTFCGTPLYLSPEILVGNGYDEGVDVWALGVILYEMAVGGSPFGITRSEELMNIINEPVNLADKAVSGELKELIRGCLMKKGEERPSVKWLLGQEWVRRGQPEECRRFNGVSE